MNKELEDLLNIYWLRPETAIWRFIDIKSMDGFEFKSPSMDLGCGDGIFSFIRAGGRIESSFDVFRNASGMENFFQNFDVYDAFREELNIKIIDKPTYQIDVGFDHKNNLLRKAKSLDFYKELHEGDANKRLAFDDETFSSIFSNILYWLDDPEFSLMEISRILKRSGNVCLMLPDISFPEFSFYNSFYVRTKDPDWKFLEKLDRGRLSSNIKQSKSFEEWERIFRNSGLRVKKHTKHLSKPIVQIWDIGLRPLFPAIMEMVSNINKEKIPHVKEMWVKNIMEFAEPLVRIDEKMTCEGAAFHCYILEKDH
ncbi:class I SAM-dependent methyltransferase [Azospirillum argentinense]|uniref:Methyltransferase type 11 domain-containing protein n=1 Tax=Azospirillum argentinense TaxID=2970906 RepID=A0A5B0KWN4_9PROT|nr:methyltransferase domain-containing protein [Azospirillum argentinense]KAA1056385.1 hypothetical protein FH063_004533 [Azospirillum argentinense]